MLPQTPKYTLPPHFHIHIHIPSKSFKSSLTNKSNHHSTFPPNTNHQNLHRPPGQATPDIPNGSCACKTCLAVFSRRSFSAESRTRSPALDACTPVLRTELYGRLGFDFSVRPRPIKTPLRISYHRGMEWRGGDGVKSQLMLLQKFWIWMKAILHDLVGSL